MKTFFALIAFILSSWFVSCDQTNDDVIIIPDSENIKSENRNLDVFNKIDISDGIQVVVNRGDTQSVKVITDEDVLPKVLTTVSNGKLTGRIKGSVKTSTLRIEISLPDITEVTLDDAVMGSLSGFHDINYLKLALSNGASLKVSGSADKLDTVVLNAANLDGLELIVNQCDASLSSASKMSIFCKTILSGNVSELSILSYKGNPQIKVETSTLGQLINLD